jgi:hypothetical protein
MLHSYITETPLLDSLYFVKMVFVSLHLTATLRGISMRGVWYYDKYESEEEMRVNGWYVLIIYQRVCYVPKERVCILKGKYALVLQESPRADELVCPAVILLVVLGS